MRQHLLLLTCAALLPFTSMANAGGKKKDGKTPRKANRLIHEKSPYLLQHAYNPVDWYSWGKEALEKARRDNRLLFVSIGYSTCHWCHVMEKKVFEDPKIAALMNRHLVSIKIDREERPDLDKIYMAACQAQNRSGGWPLSAFCTPDGRPFWTGTYIPPRQFVRIVEALVGIWNDPQKRARIFQVAGHLSAHVAKSQAHQVSGKLPNFTKTLAAAASNLSQAFDARWAGFFSAPKFPPSQKLRMLLRHHHRTGDKRSLEMLTRTLDAMWQGGMYDHVGGGFHRYSVDRRWHVPHFEKMLYDNASLARVYAEAWQVTGMARYARVARQIIEYNLREMRMDGGAFASAEDADSEGEEGTFYVWTYKEIVAVLGKEDGKFFCRLTGATEKGNWEHGKNVLHLPRIPSDRELARMGRLAVKLLAVRSKRPRPHKDDKILTSWNALAIGSFAYAGAVLGEPRYVEAAAAAARFILDRMIVKGRLYRRHRDGQTAIGAMLPDHAYLVRGLLDLYEADFDPRWLEAAVDLAGKTIALFKDTKKGGYFFDPADGEKLLARSKEIYDGARPNPNAVLAIAFARLGRMTGNERWTKEARSILEAFAGQVPRFPHAYASYLIAHDFIESPSRELVVVGARKERATRTLVDVVRSRFVPGRVILQVDPADRARIDRLVEFVRPYFPVGGKPTAYFCIARACKAPTGSPEEVLKSLLES